MQALLSLIKVNAKAIVAFIATFLVATVGLEVPADVQVALASLVVALIAWLVPNTGAKGK